MRARLSTLAVLVAATAAMLALSAPANATVHEIVAAYCSGGGHGAIGADGFLEAPGVSDFDKKNFAQPVQANGAVTGFPPVITDHPAAKFPAGSGVFTLDVSQADHPSAAHCKALNP